MNEQHTGMDGVAYIAKLFARNYLLWLAIAIMWQ